jgi:hypothetical protein
MRHECARLARNSHRLKNTLNIGGKLRETCGAFHPAPNYTRAASVGEESQPSILDLYGFARMHFRERGARSVEPFGVAVRDSVTYEFQRHVHSFRSGPPRCAAKRFQSRDRFAERQLYLAWEIERHEKPHD